MAGSYPDTPGPQIMYDRDGSVGFSIDSGNNITQFTQGELDSMNNESTDGPRSLGQQSPGIYVGVIFPQLIDLVGYCLTGQVDDTNQSEWNTLEYSTDTTNGLDGTWTTLRASGLGRVGGVKPGYRDNIQTQVVGGIKAIRFYMPGTGSGESSTVYTFHLYGTITTGEVPHRLRIWHPTTDTPLTGPGLDFGDISRLSNPIKTFRVKNISGTLTANSIVISREALTDASPTVVGVTTIDNAGSGYAASQNIGSLAPGAISGIISLKLSPGASAALGLWRQRIKAAASSWT